MTLAPGSRIGPYEVVARVGAGGMGEVYRARDSRLKRDVAIKTLPASFAADPERLARFEREAQALAALNHPNIAQIHGLEEAGSVRGLVMEFVDGQTLAEMIEMYARPGGKASSGAGMPLDAALPIARQVATALEAAHERGIVHRDLKPANIKVTAEGEVKVLDFGLAKALTGYGDVVSASSQRRLANSPTELGPADFHQGYDGVKTEAGIVLGTAAYMSPEQARGKDVDKRADIWAFGVVLFEMLTGTPPFAGETVSDVMAAVLTREIDWRVLPEDTPRSVERVLRRSLERDPRKRLRFDTERLTFAGATRSPSRKTSGTTRRSPRSQT